MERCQMPSPGPPIVNFLFNEKIQNQNASQPIANSQMEKTVSLQGVEMPYNFFSKKFPCSHNTTNSLLYSCASTDMRKEKTSQLMLQSHSLFYFLQISSHCSFLLLSLFLLPGTYVGATFSKSLQYPPLLNSYSLYFISWRLQHCPSTNRLPNTTRKKTIPPLFAQNCIVVPASYAISPDHPQQMQFRFFKILSKNNKYKYKWRSAERTLPSKLPSTNRLRNKTHKKTNPPLFAQNCMLIPPPTPFLPILLNKSISDSSKFFTKKLKSRKIKNNLRKAEKKTVASKLKLTNRLRNKTREKTKPALLTQNCILLPPSTQFFPIIHNICI